MVKIEQVVHSYLERAADRSRSDEAHIAVWGRFGVAVGDSLVRWLASEEARGTRGEQVAGALHLAMAEVVAALIVAEVPEKHIEETIAVTTHYFGDALRNRVDSLRAQADGGNGRGNGREESSS